MDKALYPVKLLLSFRLVKRQQFLISTNNTKWKNFQHVVFELRYGRLYGEFHFRLISYRGTK